MTPQGYERLVADEGERLKVYKDTKGIATIGVGFNLEEASNRSVFKSVTGMTVEQAIQGTPITKAHSRELLRITSDRARADAEKLLPDLGSYPPVVQDALVNFVFNVGLGTASQFRNTLAAIKRGDGKAAANGLRQSLYYKQVGARGERVAKALESLSGSE